MWAGANVNGHVLPESGAASYHLTLRGVAPGRYTLFMPKTYGGYRIWVNGRLVSSQGHFGLTKATSIYGARAQRAVIEADGGDLNLQFDMSTFHHGDNGLMDVPVFGATDAMNTWMLMEMIRSLLLCTSLLLLSCLGAVLFVFRPEDRTSLYLALGTGLLLPLAAMLSHDNLLAIALPQLSFAGMMICSS
jgi:hypothetical protein